MLAAHVESGHCTGVAPKHLLLHIASVGAQRFSSQRTSVEFSHGHASSVATHWSRQRSGVLAGQGQANCCATHSPVGHFTGASAGQRSWHLAASSTQILVAVVVEVDVPSVLVDGHWIGLSGGQGQSA
jgi:hypothetical protein